MTLDALIAFAIEVEASDIHIAPNAFPMFRINGVIHSHFETQTFQILSFEKVDRMVKALCDSEQYTPFECVWRSELQLFSSGDGTGSA